MAWVKLDDQMIDHPKIEAIGVVGLGLHVAGLCYANQHLTDGFISATRVPLLIDMGDVDRRWEDAKSLEHPAIVWAAVLVGAGVWEEVEDGYQIHDYLKYQPSRRDVLKEREKRRGVRVAAGQQGGKQTASKRAANVQQGGEQSFSPVARSPLPVLTQSVSARVARDWFVLAMEREPDAMDREMLLNLDVAHPPECIGWAWEKSAGADSRWLYAKGVLEHCLMEGHGPKVKPLRAASSGQRQPSEPENTRGVNTGAGLVVMTLEQEYALERARKAAGG